MLEPTIHPSRTFVRQIPPADFKPGPDMNTVNEYGQFVELGGKRRRTKKYTKRRRSKKSIRKRKSKKHRK